MNVINPFIGSVLQSPQVQRQQADAKASQVRRAQELARNVAAESDRYTHTVESPEALKPVHDERDEARKKRKQRRRQPADEAAPADEESPRLDLKA